MTTIYSNNFDAESVGALPAGWVNKIGTWAVRASGAVSAPNCLANSSGADGDVVLYTGAAALADMDVSFSTKQSASASPYAPPFGVILRSDAANANHYVLLISPVTSGSGNVQLYKKIGGSYASVGTANYSLSVANGDTVRVRATVIGTTISFYIGNGTLPGTPTATFSDSSISAAGYTGFYYSPTVGTMGADDFLLADTTVPQTNALTNNTAGVLFSPGTWDVQASSAKTIDAGAYFKTLFSGTSCTLNFDMASVADPKPQLWYRVDGYGPWTQVLLAASIAITIPAATAGYANKPGHLLEVVVKATTESQPRWAGTATAVRLTGIILDAGSSISAPGAKPLRGLFFGDSITEGVRTVKTLSTPDTDCNDSMQGWAFTAGQMLGAEVGIVGFGASGLTVTGSGSVPPLPSSYNLLYQGVTRSFANLDFIVLMEGTNDGNNDVTSAATSVLNGLLAANSVVKVIVLRPFDGIAAGNGTTHAGQLQAAIAACSAPARVTYVDTAGWFTTANSSDQLHPYGVENITHIAPLAATAIRSALGTASAITNSVYISGTRLRRSPTGATATPGKRLRLA